MPGCAVREAQDRFEGWTPTFGYLEMRARAVIIAAVHGRLVDGRARGRPGDERRDLRRGDLRRRGRPGASAEVGMGLHAFRDPRTAEDFAAPRVPIDVADFHTYAVDWTEDAVEFFGRRQADPSMSPAADLSAADDAWRVVRLPRVARSGMTPTPCPSSSST